LQFSRLAPLRGFAASLQLTVQSFQFSVFSLSWEFVPDFNLFLCGAAAPVLVLRRTAPPNLPQTGDTASTARDRPSLM